MTTAADLQYDVKKRLMKNKNFFLDSFLRQLRVLRDQGQLFEKEKNALEKLKSSCAD
jgi:hypothetical protein